MIQSYQKKFIGKAKKDFNRLPENIQKTVMGYVSRGFWFLEVVNKTNTYWLIKLGQYSFLEDENGKASEKGWVCENLYKVYTRDAQLRLARSRTINPDGKEIYRSIIKL